MPTSFGKVDYSLKVRDFRGRTVFEKNISAVSSLSFVWDGRDKGHSVLPAGVYTLSLEARALGRSPYRATRRLLKL
jgi:cytidylate kinase